MVKNQHTQPLFSLNKQAKVAATSEYPHQTIVIYYHRKEYDPRLYKKIRKYLFYFSIKINRLVFTGKILRFTLVRVFTDDSCIDIYGNIPILPIQMLTISSKSQPVQLPWS